MNCKRARSLFSARVDGELSSEEARSLEMHLRDCREGCRERWVQFETTVQLVRTLPPIEPDPSFVGQVLDRVRAWEAQEAGRTTGAVVRVPVFERSWSERVREWVGLLTDSRPLAPVRIAGAVALGIACGLMVGYQGFGLRLVPAGHGISSLAERASATAPAVPGAGSGRVQSVSTHARPFSDLATEIPAVRSDRVGADSSKAQPDGFGDDQLIYPGVNGNRQVVTTPGDARPRVTVTDGRAQITF